MKSITIRGIEPPVADRLKKEAKSEGKSINQFIKDVINERLGLGKRMRSATYHDLDHLFGRWEEDEFQQIKKKIDHERRIDPELWT